MIVIVSAMAIVSVRVRLRLRVRVGTNEFVQIGHRACLHLSHAVVELG